MRTLVISPCLEGKRNDVPAPARAQNLADPERQWPADARSEAFPCPLAETCTGAHHRLVMDGVQAVWDRWGREVLDWAILSGSHGLLHAYEVVMPSDSAMDPFEPAGLAGREASLRISEQATALVRDYDLTFYLLSERHLAVLGLPLEVPEAVQQIVLADQESLALVPSLPNMHPFLADGGVAARRWHVKTPQVRGFLFKRLCSQVVYHGPAILAWLYQQPGDTERLFYKRARWRPQWRLW